MAQALAEPPMERQTGMGCCQPVPAPVFLLLQVGRTLTARKSKAPFLFGSMLMTHTLTHLKPKGRTPCHPNPLPPNGQ